MPADCDVLALIGAKQPYQAATREAVKSWTEAGGRLIAAPDVSELYEERTGGAVDLLRSFDARSASSHSRGSCASRWWASAARRSTAASSARGW